MIWVVLVVAYIVSVALSIVAVRFVNRSQHEPPVASDVALTLTPIMNVVIAVAVFIHFVRSKSHMPRFLWRLYGGE